MITSEPGLTCVDDGVGLGWYGDLAGLTIGTRMEAVRCLGYKAREHSMTTTRTIVRCPAMASYAEGERGFVALTEMTILSSGTPNFAANA